MAAPRVYADGQLPEAGDYVRSAIPWGPVNALTVYRIERDGTVASLEDVTHTIREIPARHLTLIRRAISETRAA